MKTKISGSPILTIRNNKDLYLDGINAEEIFSQFDSPFFVYSENIIKANCKEFTRLIKKYFKNYEIFYSYKSNPFQKICEIVHSHGIGAEVVSQQELNQALRLNLKEKSIIVGTPYLTPELLEQALTNQVINIGCWSLSQLEYIKNVAAKVQVNPNLTIRIRPKSYKKTLGIKIIKDSFNKIIESLKTTTIKITGLHSHFSTQLMKTDLYLENLELIIESNNLFESLGIDTIDTFNLGGGFPEASILKTGDLENIFLKIRDRLRDIGLDKKKIVFEPGRYFISDAGMVFCKVLDIFEDHDEIWVRLDIGTNFLPRTSKSNFKFFNVNKISQPNEERINILGNLPSETDFFTKNYLFVKDVKINDIILITNAGAYTHTWSTHFPYPKPHQVLITKDKVIRSLNQ